MKSCTKCMTVKPDDAFYAGRYWCKQCFIAYARKWSTEHKDRRATNLRQYYESHKEEFAQRRKQWWADRPDKLRAVKVAWRGKNREKVRQYSAAWKKKNPGWNAVHHSQRRARKLNASGHCSREALLARIFYYGEKCYLCGAPYEHVDHVIPLSKGGSNWPANLRPACASCNLKKHDKILIPLKEINYGG